MMTSRDPGPAQGQPAGGDPLETVSVGASSEGAERSGGRSARARRLSTVGELVEGGGNRGALGILAYLVIGTAFWSLVGFLLDYLVGTQWLVLLGAGIGFAAGLTLAYLHLQAGLKTNDGPDTGDDARNRPARKHQHGHGHD